MPLRQDFFVDWQMSLNSAVAGWGRIVRRHPYGYNSTPPFLFLTKFNDA